MNLFIAGFVPPGWSKGDGLLTIGPKNGKDGVVIRIARWSKVKTLGQNPVLAVVLRPEYLDEYYKWVSWWDRI